MVLPIFRIKRLRRKKVKPRISKLDRIKPMTELSSWGSWNTLTPWLCILYTKAVLSVPVMRPV